MTRPRDSRGGFTPVESLLAIDYRRGLSSRDSLLVYICALYWHFVDVVWIVIFTLVYLLK